MVDWRLEVVAGILELVAAPQDSLAGRGLHHMVDWRLGVVDGILEVVAGVHQVVAGILEVVAAPQDSLVGRGLLWRVCPMSSSAKTGQRKPTGG